MGKPMINRLAKPLFFLFALIILCGVGLKVSRYNAPLQRMDDTFEHRMTSLLQNDGWQIQPAETSTKDSAVRIITFAKESCPAPLHISIVGKTSGLESYLRQKFGDDLAFVQHGVVLQSPSFLRHQMMTTLTRAIDMFSGARSETRPILAVIPAPKTFKQVCSGPDTATWTAL